MREEAFIAPIDRLCAGCHQPFKGYSHPVGVAPSMVIPGNFSVDSRGRILCSTCHDPHLEVTSDNPYLLRGPERGKQFCRQCHQDAWNGSSSHAGIGRHAHPGAEGPGSEQTSGGLLDEGSLDCLECHLGTIGPQANFTLAAANGSTPSHGSGSHPVGVDYAAAADANRQLRPPTFLPEEIQLPEGQVGCVTCHNPYSPLPYMLPMSNGGSALCLACHLK